MCNTPWLAQISIQSNVECLFLESWEDMARWPCRSRSMTSIFDIIQENVMMRIWFKCSDSSSNNDKLLHRQTKFPITLIQNGQNYLGSPGHSPLFSIPSESILEFMIGANLVIPAQICGELWCVQDTFSRILSQNPLEGQGQCSLVSIPAQHIPWCMFGTKLGIPTQSCNDLSHGQTKFPRIQCQNG